MWASRLTNTPRLGLALAPVVDSIKKFDSIDSFIQSMIVQEDGKTPGSGGTHMRV
jgi:hypothetical protein